MRNSRDLPYKYCSTPAPEGEEKTKERGVETKEREKVFLNEGRISSVEKRETERKEGRRRGSLKQRGRIQTHQH